MFAPHTFVVALLMVITSAMCWDSLANTLSLHSVQSQLDGQAKRPEALYLCMR